MGIFAVGGLDDLVVVPYSSTLVEYLVVVPARVHGPIHVRLFGISSTEVTVPRKRSMRRGLVIHHSTFQNERRSSRRAGDGFERLDQSDISTRYTRYTPQTYARYTPLVYTRYTPNTLGSSRIMYRNSPKRACDSSFARVAT